ncbi:uncharacterized protein N7459_003446 [Penicillium hispanicum]|uniref:uncharacterized protein n=1 Tax=Penicillium hispanicum TaxID=1080232 RepID=UPI0025408498|nr:uncharacterized protein N7459_003446 [Penicillium hispanicum]KAJ5587681.1 hypothetical protein N7459_003446 [Penicillium hispanicum]
MPSLTLTDPDMILPYDGSERESSTPSPPSQLVYLSNLNARYNAADPHAGSSARPKKNFSRSAWTHEDVNVSRRLSDIGEELSPARSSGFYGHEDDARPEQGLASSPVLPDQLPASENKGNAAWSSSSSTVSAGSARASKETSSSEVDRDASPNQAEEEKKPEAPVEIKTGLPDSHAIASAAAKGKGPGEEFSSAILSSEAERILENAKKRLTLMEGNLNRARSSVRLTPSPSPSAPGSIQPMGFHQPAGGLYRSISRTDRRGSALRRQSFVPSQDASTNRHSRVHSETNFPPEASLSSDTKRLSRSVSAMGASTSSNFHNDDRSFQYDPTRAYLTHRSSISSTKRSPSEQAQSPQSPQSSQPTQSPVFREDSPMESPKGLGIDGEDESKSTPGDFSPVYSSYGPPSRAQSQLQVRDLQYQMKGLHIKISSLKVRTQEDNLRRRSIQSLRTPSPLTAADPWYANAMELRDGRSSRGSNAMRDSSSEYVREAQSSNEIATGKHHTESHEPERADDSPVDRVPMTTSALTANTWQSSELMGYDDGRQSAVDSMYEDAEEGDYEDGDIDREALDEILREPLDEDLESPVVDATPHEEREDAFDYEHFILHSALGNYSRQLRRASHSSHGSVETTRPKQTVRHTRTDSAMSDSTVATFATATEGEQMPEDEDDIDSVMYWDRRFNHELRHRHHSHHSHQPAPAMETYRPETPRGPRGIDSGSVTPVDGGPQTPRGTNRTGRSSSATTGSATPTSLASSLVSTVRAASSPHPGSATPTSGGINEDDTQILEQLFQSLGNVCMDLQAITTSPEPDLKAARLLRRRLDAARRVLDGELDA